MVQFINEQLKQSIGGDKYILPSYKENSMKLVCACVWLVDDDISTNNIRTSWDISPLYDEYFESS